MLLSACRARFDSESLLNHPPRHNLGHLQAEPHREDARRQCDNGGVQGPSRRGAFQELIDGRPASTFKLNDTFGEMFKKIFDTADDESIKIAELLLKDGETAQTANLQREARKLFMKAIAARDGRSGAGLCQDKEAGRNRVAEMQAYVVDMQEARARAQSLVLDDEAKIELAEDKLELAKSLEEMGKLDAAMAMYHQGLDAFVRVRGQHCEDVAEIRRNIGNVFESLGKYEEALQMYEQAQEVFLAVCGPDSLSVARTYNNQGNLYESLTRYDDAMEAYSKSLDIRIELVGETHPLVAEAQNNIARVYGRQRKLEKALEMLCAVLETRTRVCGPSSRDVGNTKYNID